MPERFAHGMQRGAELFELKECGATFSYPDALTPDEWGYLKAAQRGHVKNENENEKIRKQQEEWERKQARR